MTEIENLDGEKLCSNPACRVGETGKCVEGLDLTECPQYGVEAEANSLEDATEVDDESAAIEAPLAIGLPHGNTLDISEARTQLLRGDSRIIAIVGPRDVGKTSLIASIYEIFQDQTIDGVKFAGSTTLHGFERSCHDARLASHRRVPHMERTPRGEVKFYHLELAGGLAGGQTTLLLADRAGEQYDAVADDVTNAADLPEIPRADTVTILVDGKRLLDDVMRHNLLSDLALILQGMVDGGIFVASQRIALVLTKHDLVTASANRGRAERDFEQLCDRLTKILVGHIARIETFKIAASPKTSDVPRGQGVGALFNFWLEEISSSSTVSISPPSYQRAIARLQTVDEGT